MCNVLVVGQPAIRDALRASGVSELELLEKSPASWAFDEATHHWEVRTDDGRRVAARIVITTGPHPPGREQLRPYLGVAVHGAPNCFLLPARDPDAAVGYIAECLAVMARTADTRIEVRYSAQRVFHDRVPEDRAIDWRLARTKIESAFDLSSHVEVADEVYDGPARIDGINGNRPVRVRLSGHLDPIDGRYHWRGTVFGELPGDVVKAALVSLAIGNRTAPARIGERTPWGHSITGTGAPPFALTDTQVDVPTV